MSRTWNVVRMQYINRQTYLWVPIMIFAGAFLLTLAIYGIILNAAGGEAGPMYGGGAQAPLWYFGIVGVQALTLSFPFSQAMSVTRREFFLGTFLAAVITALVLAALFVAGGLIEQATGGWGMDGYVFYLPWVWESGPLMAGLFYLALAMVFFTVGFWAATAYKRWGAMVLTIVLLGFALLLVAAMWLIGLQNAWVPVIEWIGAQGVGTLVLAQTLLVAVLGGGAFLTLRRAIP